MQEFVKKVAFRKINKNKEKKFEMNPVYFNVGFYLLVPLLLGIFIGYQADKMFKTKPIFVLIGIGFGTISSFYNLWKLLKE